jgi:hypothetical protein
VPFVKPVTTSGLAVPVAVFPSGDDVTVYEVIAAPPSDAGGVNDTTACPSPGAADAPGGGPGTVRGVTGAEGADAAPVPAAEVAVTEKVYAVPFVSPPTTTGLVAPVAVAPPGLAVTV